MKKLFSVSLVAFALIASLAFMSFRPAADGEIKITAAELKNTPFEKLIVADGTIGIESCVVTVEFGKESKSYNVKWYAQPEELKTYFASVQTGTKILIQKRIGSDGNGKHKLPTVVYVVVDKP